MTLGLTRRMMQSTVACDLSVRDCVRQQPWGEPGGGGDCLRGPADMCRKAGGGDEVGVRRDDERGADLGARASGALGGRAGAGLAATGAAAGTVTTVVVAVPM